MWDLPKETNNCLSFRYLMGKCADQPSVKSMKLQTSFKRVGESLFKVDKRTKITKII